jgi:hypothetical protein
MAPAVLHGFFYNHSAVLTLVFESLSLLPQHAIGRYVLPVTAAAKPTSNPNSYTRLAMLYVYWGEPERAPHKRYFTAGVIYIYIYILIWYDHHAL